MKKEHLWRTQHHLRGVEWLDSVMSRMPQYSQQEGNPRETEEHDVMEGKVKGRIITMNLAHRG
jgi:hypothetical protein